MARGINRADPRLLNEQAFESYGYGNKKCVFISHKSEDKAAAKEIAEYIRDKELDVYLDVFDSGLQQATREGDVAGIVSGIEKALTRSTDILVLITDKTQQSWWVPYEIGYSKKGGRGIASLLLKTAENFPDYLEIERKLRGKADLDGYLSDLARASGLRPALESFGLPRRDLYTYIRG